MRDALVSIRFSAPSVPLVANVTAAPETDPSRFAPLLVEQVTARVRWRESLLAMASLGADGTVELGAGRVLTGLSKRVLEGTTSTALGTPEEIDAHLSEIGGVSDV
jgi:[acyl-carrier-protein] S-malonyltransferase